MAEDHNQSKGIVATIKLVFRKIKQDGVGVTLMRYKASLYRYVKDMRYKLHNLSKTNFELAIYHFQHGNVSDAILRFRILRKFFRSQYSKYIVSEYYLGRCYMEELKYDKAKEHLANYLNSDNTEKLEEADFCLKLIEGKTSDIKIVPYSIISHNFDIVSTKYNAIFFNDRESPPQKVIYNLLHKTVQRSSKPFANNILDLGCGTGIIGKLCRNAKIASNIVGIDISEGMLNQAASLQIDKEPVYNYTFNTNADLYLQITKINNKYDIVILSNLITYSANFTNILEKLDNFTTDQAIIGITFRTIDDRSKEWEFMTRIEQFWYNPEYIITTAEMLGWHIVEKKGISFIGGEKGMAVVISKVPLLLESDDLQVQSQAEGAAKEVKFKDDMNLNTEGYTEAGKEKKE